MFRVTHVDVRGLRCKAHVTGCCRDNCIEQIETALGEHVGLAVIRLGARPALELVEKNLTRKNEHA